MGRNNIIIVKIPWIREPSSKKCLISDRAKPRSLGAFMPNLQGAQPFKYSAIHPLLRGHFQVNLAVQHLACRRGGNSINFNGWSASRRPQKYVQRALIPMMVPVMDLELSDLLSLVFMVGRLHTSHTTSWKPLFSTMFRHTNVLWNKFSIRVKRVRLYKDASGYGY